MCGIVGIASLEQRIDQPQLRAARSALRHRGPDDSGEWYSDDGLVGMAHQRLAVIDLSPSGHQPMRYAERGLTVIFNGEIYNFRELRSELTGKYSFKSESDTEVLLAAYEAWGADCIHRLDGMFAFAIFDAKRSEMFLARDRAGEKPLYYCLHKGTLHFASELKSLLHFERLPKSIDLEAMDCYLATGYVPGELCILKGFAKLPPAHTLLFNLQSGVVKIQRYWELPPNCEDPIREVGHEEALIDELDELLESSVSSQLVADVPVGILLSGGVDSSLITAMASRSGMALNTFTVGFSGHPELDETKHARLIAEHFDTNHTELRADSFGADDFIELAKQFDEPMADSSMIPTFQISKLMRKHCTVAIGGDGGDELFGGYNHYNRLLWMNFNLCHVPKVIRGILAKFAERTLPLGFGGSNIRSWLLALRSDLGHELPFVANLFDPFSRSKLIDGGSEISAHAERILGKRVPECTDLLQRATRMDFSNYLAEDILVKVDRASMLNSLEIRAPLLDRRVIEFAFGQIPSGLKATDSSRKILLKKLARRILPDSFDFNRKQGFSIPINDWARKGSFRDVLNEVLLDPDCVFNTHNILKLLKGQDRGRLNGERLFSLVLFELWRKQYNITL